MEARNAKHAKCIEFLEDYVHQASITPVIEVWRFVVLLLGSNASVGGFISNQCSRTPILTG